MARELSVTHAEMDGWPKERRTALQFQATRRLKCAWTDRAQLLIDALSWPGHIYPYATGSRTNAFCVSGAVESLGGKQSGEGDDLERASYAEAIVTLDYETPGRDTPRTGSGRSIVGNIGAKKFIELFEPTFDNVVLPHDKFQWGTGADAEPLEPDEAPAKTIIGNEYTFRVVNASFVAQAAFDLQGKVNDGAISPRLTNRFFLKETLLYAGVFIERTSEHLGGLPADRLDVVYKFIYQPHGWNRFPHAVGIDGVTDFREIYLRDPGDQPHKVYPTGNFLDLTF